jgi:hypothetical protein
LVLLFYWSGIFMHRIDTTTAQIDKFGLGKNGFTAGNPQTGELATDLDNDYFDSVQEEICGVIESAGIALNKLDRNQLVAAIKLLTGSGRLLNIQILTSSQAYSRTPGAMFGIVEGIGGGGPGGGATAGSSTSNAVGSGGTSGSYGKCKITLDDTPIIATIGAGGLGNIGASGSVGGVTSFGSFLSCPGGNSGYVGTAPGAAVIAGSGPSPAAVAFGEGATPILSIPGAPGSIGVMISLAGGVGGHGASSPLGTGGYGSALGAGRAGTGYGTGGSGALNTNATLPAVAGGNGAPGAVIVWEYA